MYRFFAFLRTKIDVVMYLPVVRIQIRRFLAIRIRYFFHRIQIQPQQIVTTKHFHSGKFLNISEISYWWTVTSRDQTLYLFAEATEASAYQKYTYFFLHFE